MPSICIITFLLLSLTLLIGKSMIDGQISDEKRAKVTIGICGAVHDSYLGMGLIALQEMDSSSDTIYLQIMEEAEAQDALRNGELAAYMVVQEGFVESVMHGINNKIIYYTADADMGINTELMDEITKVISSLIVESQNGIYGMQELFFKYEPGRDYWEITDELQARYMNLIFDRTDFFDVKILGISDSLSLQAYYICGFSVFFFMLFGLSGCPVLIRKDRALSRQLASKGLGALPQVLAEWVAYLLLVIPVMLCIFAVLGNMVKVFELSVPEWRWISFNTVFSFGIELIPVVIMISAMTFFVYELTDNIVVGMLLYFLVTVGMGFVSGCFYPRSFLPDIMYYIGKFLPSGIGIEYAIGSIGSKVPTVAGAGVMIYTALFLCVAVFLRQGKLVRNK